MSENFVQFFVESLDVFIFTDQKQVADWLLSVASEENKDVHHLNYIFCSDEYLLNINRTYLDHDYFTDIITFPIHDIDQPIEADLFISVERVRENATILKLPFKDELNRVIVHGLLHLLGYGDKTDDEINLMRKKENHYLKSFNSQTQ